eukprot:4419786-Amphidinium_carterae.1
MGPVTDHVSHLTISLSSTLLGGSPLVEAFMTTAATQWRGGLSVASTAPGTAATDTPGRGGVHAFAWHLSLLCTFACYCLCRAPKLLKSEEKGSFVHLVPMRRVKCKSYQHTDEQPRAGCFKVPCLLPLTRGDSHLRVQPAVTVAQALAFSFMRFLVTSLKCICLRNGRIMFPCIDLTASFSIMYPLQTPPSEKARSVAPRSIACKQVTRGRAAGQEVRLPAF